MQTEPWVENVTVLFCSENRYTPSIYLFIHTSSIFHVRIWFCMSSLSFTDADEQQHSNHRSHGDGRRRQAANQTALLRHHLQRGRGQGGHGAGRGRYRGNGRSRKGGRETDDAQHHREALPIVHQRQDPGDARPRDGQRRQGVCAALHSGTPGAQATV